MSIRMGRPLPECRLCDIPTARKTYLRTGGLCGQCDEGVSGVAATVRMARLPPAPDQFVTDCTGFVEGYRPPVPVPVQLRIDEEGHEL